MARDPGIGYKVVATVVEAKGECGAGHVLGDTFEISCHNAAGLCGFFYHHIYADLQTFQFGGTLPWWQEGEFQARCPDPANELTLRLSRSVRE